MIESKLFLHWVICEEPIMCRHSSFSYDWGDLVADTVSLALLPRVLVLAEKLYYIPYTALNRTTAMKAVTTAESELVALVEKKTVPNGMDRRNEDQISLQNWMAAAKVAEKLMKRFHPERLAALQAHHANVQALTTEHELVIAMRYDIRQRELAAADTRHDYSILKEGLVSQIAIAYLTGMHQAITKRAAPSSFAAQPSVKRIATGSTSSARGQATGSCFRCGNAGHHIASCSASTTVAGIPCASRSASRENALVGSDGQDFCGFWSRGGHCRYGSSCRNHHLCSICGDSSHGAAKCTARA